MLDGNNAYVRMQIKLNGLRRVGAHFACHCRAHQKLYQLTTYIISCRAKPSCGGKSNAHKMGSEKIISNSCESNRQSSCVSYAVNVECFNRKNITARSFPCKVQTYKFTTSIRSLIHTHTHPHPHRICTHRKKEKKPFDFVWCEHMCVYDAMCMGWLQSLNCN